MTITDVQPASGALLAPPSFATAPKAEKIVNVARRYGISPLRQGREMLTLSMAEGKLKTYEYFDHCVYDPEIPMREKRQYVGVAGSYKLNIALSPKELCGGLRVVSNKSMYTALIKQLGFRTTETQAVVSNMRRFGNIPCLDTPERLRRFLLEEARFPLFGKPQAYSGSFGSALLDRVEDDQMVLGDGRRLPLDAFCKEIVAEYGEGYLLQSAIKQHPEVSDIIGRAIGTVRVVTIRDEMMPRVLYALWKIPSPDAMSDNFWQDGSMIAPVDKETGKVGKTWVGTGLDSRVIDAHPVSGKVFDGAQLPDWSEACKMASEAHALFPEFGVIGWDVAMTDEGPLLIECNDNPFHSLYQMAYRRGIRNDDLRPALDRTIALSKKILSDKNKRIRDRRERRKKK